MKMKKYGKYAACLLLIVSPMITSCSDDDNDFNTKLRAGQKFLKDGDRLKVTVRFRGRQMAHTNLGEKLLMDFAEACAETATMEKNPKLEGRFMGMFLAPKNSK